MLLFVCSTRAILQPLLFNFFLILEIEDTCSQSKDSVAPSAVLSISLFGGEPVIPTKYIFLMRKASDVLKQDPILFKLLTLSNIIITSLFFFFLN